MTDKHDNNKDIGLKGAYSVINSNKRTKTQLGSNKPSLVSYDEVRDNFLLPRIEALAMDSFINVDGHTIQYLPLPVINHQSVNKQYTNDNFLKLLRGTMTSDNRIIKCRRHHSGRH